MNGSRRNRNELHFNGDTIIYSFILIDLIVSLLLSGLFLFRGKV